MTDFMSDYYAFLDHQLASANRSRENGEKGLDKVLGGILATLIKDDSALDRLIEKLELDKPDLVLSLEKLKIVSADLEDPNGDRIHTEIPAKQDVTIYVEKEYRNEQGWARDLVIIPETHGAWLIVHHQNTKKKHDQYWVIRYNARKRSWYLYGVDLGQSNAKTMFPEFIETRQSSAIDSVPPAVEIARKVYETLNKGEDIYEMIKVLIEFLDADYLPFIDLREWDGEQVLKAWIPREEMRRYPILYAYLLSIMWMYSIPDLGLVNIIVARKHHQLPEGHKEGHKLVVEKDNIHVYRIEESRGYSGVLIHAQFTASNGKTYHIYLEAIH